jgi:serine/threonine protein kinase, bacterial
VAEQAATDGTPFGRYRLIELLGRGGMGEVWRAYDPVNARYVALKVLPANYADDQVFQERFRREARAAAGLDEPHVVPIYDSGEIDGRLFVSMRQVKGHDLQDLLEDGPVPPARAVSIIEQIAFALHAAHEVDLVHRDVKPSNILVADNDFAYLIDFGIARAAGEAGLTSTGSTIGTWAYMAPERFKREGVADARADIYALACVLYQALTGQQPFPADAIEKIAVAHMMEPPPKPSELRPEVPVAMDDVIATGMAKDPVNRYATTIELAHAARDAITTHIPQPVPPTEPTTQPVQPPKQPAAETVLDYPDTLPPQQIPGPASDPTLMATPHGPGGDVAPPGAASPHASTMLGSPSGPRLVPPTPGIPPTVERPPAPPPRLRPPWRRQKVVIPAVMVLAVIAAVVIVATGIPHRGPAESTHGSQTAPPGYGPQIALPFTGLIYPYGVAVDTTGDVYAAGGVNRVMTLAAKSSTASVLPFTGANIFTDDLNGPMGVAVDTAGSVYVASYHNYRVVKLAAGSSTASVLPYTPIGIQGPVGVAVDTAGSVYITDAALSGRVVKLTAGSNAQTVLPFTGLNGPTGVAVDTAGSVYVADSGNNRVVKLAAGSNPQTVLPFTGLNGPTGVAVDTAGSVYVADSGNNRVVKLAAGSNAQTVLPFTGLNGPWGVAVDTAGIVYIADYQNSRVLKLPAQ